MTTFQSFEDIKAWQEGRKLIRSVRIICKKECTAKDFAFIDQIKRSVRSICANIAEGHNSLTNPDFIKFLGYAKRSCAEVHSHLFDALDEGYISKKEFDELSAKSLHICNMLGKLIQYLKKTITLKRSTKPTTHNPQPITHYP